jgi:serralysin
MRSRLVALATVLSLTMASAAHAGHHLWVWTEAFSNASGSVQFIEMFTSANSEQGVGPFTITSGANTFNFVTNLPSSATANTWILCATSNFSALPGGVTPDYIIPANFINTGGGTLNYASGVQIWNYGALPTDGVHSLARDGSINVNSPKNFAGNTGSVALTVATPMMGSWGIVLLVGSLLLLGSGLLRRRTSGGSLAA